MPHSNQIREFHLSNKGIKLTPPYVGPAGVLTGSARYVQEAKDEGEEMARTEELGRLKLQLEQHRKAMESQLEAVRAEHASKEAELEQKIAEENRRQEIIKANSRRMEALRAAVGEGGELR
jgi:circadian clock protein KaiC